MNTMRVPAANFHEEIDNNFISRSKNSSKEKSEKKYSKSNGNKALTFNIADDFELNCNSS